MSEGTVSGAPNTPHPQETSAQTQEENSGGSPISNTARQLGQTVLDATKNPSPVPQPRTTDMTLLTPQNEKSTTGRALLAAQDEEATTGIVGLPVELLQKIVQCLDPKSQIELTACSTATRNAVRLTRTSLKNMAGEELPKALEKFLNLERIQFASPPSLEDINKIPGLLENVKHLDFSNCDIKLTDKVLLALLKQFPKLEHLHLSNCGSITGSAFTEMQPQCPNLKIIKLTHSYLTDQAISTLPEKCPNLEHLDLSGCKNLTGSAFTRMQAQCKSLKSINLIGCNKITHEAASALIKKKFPNVTDLKLSA